jgi:hypothetical protein
VLDAAAASINLTATDLELVREAIQLALLAAAPTLFTAADVDQATLVQTGSKAAQLQLVFKQGATVDITAITSAINAAIESESLDVSPIVTSKGSSISVQFKDPAITDNGLHGSGKEPDDASSDKSSKISGSTAAGIAIPLLLVMCAIIWWFRCSPAAVTALRSAAWKTAHEQQEKRKNTMEMEQNPLVARLQAAAAAATTAVTTGAPADALAAGGVYTYADPTQPAIYDGANDTYTYADPNRPAVYDAAKDGNNTMSTAVSVDYLEPAVVGVDYEYGPVTAGGNGGAPLYVEPNAPAAETYQGNAPLYAVPMEDAGGGPVKTVQVYGFTEEDESVDGASGLHAVAAAAAAAAATASTTGVGADYRVPTSPAAAALNGGAVYAAADEDSYTYTSAAASVAQGGPALYDTGTGDEGYLAVGGAPSSNAAYMQNDALYN